MRADQHTLQTPFFVLTDEMFEYYEDENSYLAEKERGLRGSIPARNIKVSNGTPRGHDKTRDGYHFTIENTSNGRVVECACQDAQGRDMWLEKIQACITTRDTPLISFDTFHSCISQAAWSDRMLDQIPLAEIEQISYQIVNCRRSRNSLESLKRQSKLSESPDEGRQEHHFATDDWRSSGMASLTLLHKGVFNIQQCTKH
jgi:hypothetical protein